MPTPENASWEGKVHFLETRFSLNRKETLSIPDEVKAVWTSPITIFVNPSANPAEIRLVIIEGKPWTILSGISKEEMLADPELLKAVNRIAMGLLKRHANYQPE